MTSDKPVARRFVLNTTVMVRDLSSGAALLAQLKNISLSGCYLETPTEVEDGTRVRVILQMGDFRADLCGNVRRRDNKGLGVQFTNGATVEDWKRLEVLIAKLEEARSATSAAAGAE